MQRKGIVVAAKLIHLVLPLMHVMLGAIVLGVMGFLCAIFIPILGGYGLVSTLLHEGIVVSTVTTCITGIVILAVLRGILRYAEQGCNHFIAFKILAEIRNKIFVKLRELAPAKLDGKDKGNLISIITSDIELLEVFFAHTISPVAIAFLTSVIMLVFFGFIHISLVPIAAAGYVIVGILIPTVISNRGRETGLSYRNGFGDLNSFVLDNIRGIKDILQYDMGEERIRQLHHKNDGLEEKQEVLKDLEGKTRAYTDMTILSTIIVMVLACNSLYSKNLISVNGMVVAIIAMASSFGPVVALSNLANNLFYTFASGNRVLDLLEESPILHEVVGGSEVEFEQIDVNNVSFSYGDEVILQDTTLSIRKNQIIGIQGKSGTGKSTLLKLIMRFYETNQGSVTINKENVNAITTSHLRGLQSYVTQETYLFNTTIAENIAVAKEDATMEEIKNAAKKASIHDRIMSFPQGYETQVGELGDSLSGGERQRIGLARAFLHDAPCMILDEPTSNLDSLNEGIILKALDQERENRTVVLVSHRKSTLGIADQMIELTSGRES